MTDKTIHRRWKSATLKLFRNATYPQKRAWRLTHSEEWVVRQMLYAGQTGRMELRYEDGQVIFATRNGQTVASALRSARPPQPGTARPLLKVVVHSQEEYDHAREILEKTRAAR